MKKNCEIKYHSKFVFQMRAKSCVNGLDVHNFLAKNFPLKWES